MNQQIMLELRRRGVLISNRFVAYIVLSSIVYSVCLAQYDNNQPPGSKDEASFRSREDETLKMRLRIEPDSENPFSHSTSSSARNSRIVNPIVNQDDGSALESCDSFVFDTKTNSYLCKQLSFLDRLKRKIAAIFHTERKIPKRYPRYQYVDTDGLPSRSSNYMKVDAPVDQVPQPSTNLDASPMVSSDVEGPQELPEPFEFHERGSEDDRTLSLREVSSHNPKLANIVGTIPLQSQTECPSETSERDPNTQELSSDIELGGYKDSVRNDFNHLDHPELKNARVEPRPSNCKNNLVSRHLQVLPTSDDNSDPLACTTRNLVYKAVRTDQDGNQCWDMVRVKVCYGRCVSGEFADFVIPFKTPAHSVCTYDRQKSRQVILENCNSDQIDSDLRVYSYMEAESCVCSRFPPAEAAYISTLRHPELSGLEPEEGSDLSRVNKL